ncbi:MAG: S41 family peptidase [Ignavibacteriales bacterium]|nr:S41 family peptidase [Ignavibacteriales bacterium]
MTTLVRVLVRSLLLIAVQLGPSLAFSQAFPVKIEKALVFDSLCIHHQRLRIDIGKGGLALIECEKGVTGAVILANGRFSFATEGDQSIRDDFAEAMIRFNPTDYLVFIRPAKAQTGSHGQIVDRSREVLERNFRFLYHSGKDALIPDEGILAGVLSGKTIGDVIVHEGGQKPSIVYSIKEKRVLFEGGKSSAKPSLESIPENQENITRQINRRYSSLQLLEDLDFIVSKLSTKEYERNPFAFVDKNYFSNVVDSARSILSAVDSMSLTQFFRLAGRIISLVRDDHATLQLGGEWARLGLEGKPYPERIVAPLSVVFKDSTCLVIGAGGIPLRANILSINGAPIVKLVSAILQTTSSSQYGALKAGLMVFFDFPKYALELYALAGLKDSARVRYIPAGRSSAVESYMTLLPYYDRSLLAQSLQVIPFQRKPPRQFRVFENTAVVGVNSLRLSNNPDTELKEWLVFLDTTFQSISAAKIPNLLIDISENGGGAERIGYMLLNYLWKGKLRTTYNSEEFALDSLVRLSIFSQMKDVSYADYKWSRFEGRVYLLIGERTFSSAARLADIFKTNRMGTIIGRPTRGFRSHYGEMASGRLPSTGLPFTWSTKFFVSASGDLEPHGIYPDVNIALDGAEDPIKVLTDELLLKKALEIIRNRQR